jgi:hypothetical protein
MKQNLMLALVILLGFNFKANAYCSSLEVGYREFCFSQPSREACNFQDQCAWSENGPNQCAAYKLAFQNMCENFQLKPHCEVNDECFWAD